MLVWGEEDIDFSFRAISTRSYTDTASLAAMRLRYHLEHPVDHETNTLPLRQTVATYEQIPELAEYRREAYARIT